MDINIRDVTPNSFASELNLLLVNAKAQIFFIYSPCFNVYLSCFFTNALKHTHLFNAGCVLLHCNLLCCALKPEKGFDVHAGGLFKTGPVFILRVNLKREYINIRIPRKPANT